MSNTTPEGMTVEQILTAKLFTKRNYRNGYMKNADTAYAFDYSREKYVTKYLKEAIKQINAIRLADKLALLDKLQVEEWENDDTRLSMTRSDYWKTIEAERTIMQERLS